MLVVAILILGLPSSGKAAAAEVNHYKIPEYQKFCGTFCHEYIVVGSIVTKVLNQDGLAELTISMAKQVTFNVCNQGSLIQTRTSTNTHGLNLENRNMNIIKLSEQFTNTNLGTGLTCDVTFDLLENVVNGQPVLVFDHGEENCYPIP